MDLTPTVRFLNERLTTRPKVLLVLGSGLGGLADALAEGVRIGFGSIPGFAPATVAGHQGALLAGRLEGVECLVLQGRYHRYEGHPPAMLALPVRAAAALGARVLIVSNAAGGVNPELRPGELMLIEDHIDLMGMDGDPAAGARLPHGPPVGVCAGAYDPGLLRRVAALARDLGVPATTGIYCAVSGPSYETPAEIRALRRMGADAVGMSTVPEVLCARALGLRVLGISLISNLAAGLRPEPLGHDDVLAAGRAAAPRLVALVRAALIEVDTALETEPG